MWHLWGYGLLFLSGEAKRVGFKNPLVSFSWNAWEKWFKGIDRVNYVVLLLFPLDLAPISFTGYTSDLQFYGHHLCVNKMEIASKGRCSALLAGSGISSPKNGRRANLVKNNPFLWPSESWNDVTQLLLMLCHLSISVLSFLFITCILLCVLFSYLFLFSHSGHSLEKLPKSLILASKTGSNLAIFSAKIQSFEQNNHSKDETFSGDF